ncbi:MAG: phosphate acyltransferase PlsX [Gammaproteobacteria bacterium]|nr:phosphate acyltransferase PlsX [Gammaproteobacteria bacterium]
MSSIIAVDAMGGDHGPSVVVPATLELLRSNPGVSAILVGDQAAVGEQLTRVPAEIKARCRVHHTTQVVGMDEAPAKALRGKKDSSMRVAVDLVKAGEAQACVSAGNTGALMATAHYVLKTMPGVDRPAIVTTLPSQTGHTLMLDLGANVNCSAENLLQFAVMGVEVARVLYDIAEPSVGLLNVGTEVLKGNQLVQDAASLLTASDLNYHGFVEGNDIYAGTTDVVVCDGFVGNVALKVTEGLATMISQFMREEFSRDLPSKAAALASTHVLKALRRRLDHRRYNGASLVGLQGVVVKSHGSSDIYAFRHAIQTAMVEAEHDVVGQIGGRLEQLLGHAA